MYTLGLVMIVKNEEKSIRKCLQSAINSGVTKVTIVDTGSTDNTPDIIKDVCKGIEITLHFSPFIDFGTNRSEALALAYKTADWLLLLDADTVVEIDKDFIPSPLVDAYLVQKEDSGLTWKVPMLVRGRIPWRYEGACHEYLTTDRNILQRFTDKVRVSFPPTQATTEKRLWHISLLEKDLDKNPNNPRTFFYLAQTYRELGESSKARELYLKCASLSTWDEESWYATYRAALLSEWPQREAELIAAWEKRPSRLEPLHDLLRELNRRSLHETAYRLSNVKISSTNDNLFVTLAAWEWGIMFERSIAAWWVGEKAESKRLCEELLKNPNLPPYIYEATVRNLQFC